MIARIRPALPHDADALARLYRDGRRATMPGEDPDRFALADFAADSAGELVLVAEADDGALAGFVSLWTADPFIHMLYVAARWQLRGIGSALLAALPGWPDQPLRLKCLVHNARAKRFYLGHGFVVTGQGRSDDGDYEELTLGQAPVRPLPKA